MVARTKPKPEKIDSVSSTNCPEEDAYPCLAIKIYLSHYYYSTPDVWHAI